MSESVVGILGLVTIVCIVITLFKSKTQPAIAFIVWPTILAIVLLIGGYFKLPDISKLIKGGFSSTGPTAALFVFSVLYFGIMTDAGMFDVIINKLMKLVGDNVIGVAVVTAIIALVGHLDGGGASTFCIVIPAMLPVYKRMHMRKTTLLRIAVLAMGVLNLMPWAGPTMRAATVINMGANKLWMHILPIQIFGIVLALAHAVFAGWQEKKRGAGLHGKLAETEGEVSLEIAEEKAAGASDLARPKLFWFNVLLTLCVIALLIVGGIDSLGLDIPNYYPFMLGTAIALFMNYGFTAKMHKKIINLHAGPALMMCSTLMGAAVLMGILVYGINVDGSAVIAKMKDGVPTQEMATVSVVTCMANLIKAVLPEFLGQNLPLVIGFLSVPLALAFDTDSYFFGMLPVVIGIGASFGVDALPIAVAMVVCRNCATFISPMVPATLLGTGLAEVDIKDHIKSSFLYVWVFSILCMIVGVIFGKLPL
ncbi:MAG: citrate transporter [Oscillospiraceae bacterium]|nr:citrate transporter [Oscillospiraceae bacterium]